ncbi:MAG: cell division protein FtsZ [Psychroflexus sp.]|nr:cell division protein FtsZ [Psychroflexus sp.]MDN6309358.1 cell division protein FtsZ [Psychroflexus sp.]
MGMELDNSIAFDLPKNQSNVIKVIGVGGGGSNAINHMFRQGINGVDFVICNTDAQALESSPVPNKIQLGVDLTEGLGAGANPDIGREAAEESVEDIKALLGTNTKMLFITAGMGGGTGTGAAPVIAKTARELDILTVGIVTIPFQFEGRTRNDQAQKGVEELRNNVDSLIVINNNKLREVYGNLGFKSGFSKADEVLATASRGIAEVITHHYTQNIDLRDAKTVLSDSGTAIMGSASASGTNRSNVAIEKALESPLLNDNKITGAQNVLLLIVSGRDEITLDEIGEINDHIQKQAGNSANIIMGIGEDEALDESITVTIIATGFNTETQDEIVNTETKKIIHTLEDEQKAEQNLIAQKERSTFEQPIPRPHPKPEESQPEQSQSRPVKPEAPQEPQQPQPRQSKLSQSNEDTFNAQTEEDFDFEIHEKTHAEEETQEKEDDTYLDFDFSAPQSNEEEHHEEVYSSHSESKRSENEMNFNQNQQEQARSESVKRYNLEDFEDYGEDVEFEPKQKQQEQQRKERSPQEEAAFQANLFTKKDAPRAEQQSSVEESTPAKEVDPFNSTIADLSARAAERRAKMKKFNYQFRNRNNIEEIEKQPAYKRAGIDLEKHERNQQNLSRTSIQNDDDGVSMKSNNSFLHDNVD